MCNQANRNINIFGEIDQDMVSRVLEQIMDITNENILIIEQNELFKNESDQMEVPEVVVNISSQGGMAHGGFAIYDALRNCGSNIVTNGMGLIMSAGLDIFLAGDDRIASEHTTFLWHPASGYARGTTKDMKQEVSHMEKLNEWGINLVLNAGVKIEKEKLEEITANGDDYIFYFHEAVENNWINAVEFE